MSKLADKLGNDYCEQLFWISMGIIAEECLKIPRHICPKCGEKAAEYDSVDNTFQCSSCENSWKKEEPTGRYVLVEFPEDTSFYENNANLL